MDLDALFNVFESEQVPNSRPAKRKIDSEKQSKPTPKTTKKKPKLRKKPIPKSKTDESNAESSVQAEPIEEAEAGEIKDDESDTGSEELDSEEGSEDQREPEFVQPEQEIQEKTAEVITIDDEGMDEPEPVSSTSTAVQVKAEPMDEDPVEIPSSTSDSAKPSGVSSEQNIKSDGPDTKTDAVPLDDDDEEEDDENENRTEDLTALQKFLPQVEVKTLETPEGSGCTHVVTTPTDNFYYIPLHPIDKPVKTYPFKLDLFQDRAVQCVDNYQSVLVSAHTSAGKTVVAEYAIAKGLKDNQRVIYTTPIKALSNQKYREFYEEFKDVGLITGDVTINPSAGCLIMTTEILRNMLYRGSEVMREVGWVVFDEIHYMRDKERGVVWEETIILLPQKTHYVFLSATIPNAVQFAQWITHLHRQPCNVIHTDYRPVPLHHYIYPAGADGIHLIVDDCGNFREDAFNTAMGMLKPEAGGGRGRGRGGANRGGMRGKKGGGSEESPCHKVIKMAMENDLSPVICFSFSRKDCENYALQLSKLDFNSAQDKIVVTEVFQNAIDVLSKEDQKLPQVESLLPILKRGIGIHHGGLLPLLKETIEILFSEGLIKVLFATETFAMGLNMPARTVMFTGMRKYDGKDYRWITSGEYIQMSGRAGRRGIDDKGITITMMDEKITPAVGRNLLKGAADPINSAFHLTYNMVLNLMRVEEINPEFMMERSFFQFQNYSSIPGVCEKLVKAEKEYQDMKVPREKDVASYYRLRQHLTKLSKEFKEFLTKPKYIVPFLQPGRMVQVTTGVLEFGWGAIVAFRRQDNPRENPMTAGDPVYVVDVLLHVSSETKDVKSTSDIRPATSDKPSEMRIVPVFLGAIDKVSQVRLYLSQDLRSADRRMAVLLSIDEVKRRFPDGIPILDPIEDLKIKDPEFKRIVKKITNYEASLHAHILHKDKQTPDLYNLYLKKMEAHAKVEDAKTELKKAKSLLQMDELKCRKRVLRRLGYSAGDDVIQIKGRVACELTSADELLLTEMIFNGVFIDLDVPQTVALLSCLVCDERSNEVPKLSQDLSGALKMMQDIARQIAKVSKECKMDIDEDDYVETFKPFLMDVVYGWAKGATFSDICAMTDIFEGGIIRCMRRLEELLRQMSLAAKVIGNRELEEKFNLGVKMIKRDIVFAASLYL